MTVIETSINSRSAFNIVNSFVTEAGDLQSKSMAWFLYDNGVNHERVKKERDLWINLVRGLF